MTVKTKWFLTVEVIETKTIEIYADTSTEAIIEANKKPDVLQVLEIKHWSEVENDLNLKEA